MSEKVKNYSDGTAKARLVLPAGASVHFQLPSGRWGPARVVNPPGTRSYPVLTEEAQVLRCNGQGLLKTEKSANQVTPAPDLDSENYELTASQ